LDRFTDSEQDPFFRPESPSEFSKDLSHSSEAVTKLNAEHPVGQTHLSREAAPWESLPRQYREASSRTNKVRSSGQQTIRNSL
jgi:hypothetical protein